MDKPRTKITEPMSDADRAALQAKLNRIIENYIADYNDLKLNLLRDMEYLEKDINKAVIAHAEKQA